MSKSKRTRRGITRRAEKEIITLYASGFGKRAIAAHMTRHGFKTARGGRIWHPHVVRLVLVRNGVWEARERTRRRPAYEAFASMFVIDESSGCHNWTGHIDRDGYGAFRGRGAHRFAFEHRHGPLKDRPLHHVCANRRCVNPVHLLPVADAQAHARLERLERDFIAEVRAMSGATC
jgi:hypothetical protein